jgi:hypothetical protein
MTRCPSCSADIVDGGAACRVCGAVLSPDSVLTVPPPPGGITEGRFRIGEVVAGRYRILGLLGRGGMGEVYRAHDIKLDQQVALKFLPDVLGRDGAAVARLHNEVRTARQVTHPNVCRVHDIGEADGVPFISMEFIDGEDLATLLQRVGRLPQDKGVEIAHGLCGALAAAHARGVLHRDLKPANIMLNRAGRVLITDFGLAAVAAQLRHDSDVVAGTPAYMAPEQLEAREVTARSDIYALGLVLYEIFTGTRVFSGLTRAAVAAPSLLVKGLSPAIDRIVLACLNDDPQRRPPSAAAIAQALPGPDPLTAAMRAGQTPSPEMVAASRATVRLSARAIAACFVGVIALLVAVYAVMPGVTDLGMAPLETPPEVLAARARDIAASAGYGARPRDQAFGFARDLPQLAHLEAHGFDWNRLADLRPGIFVWWYRESPGWLVPRGSSPAVTRDDPPPAPGSVEIVLDARSRQLLAFHAVPGPDQEGGATGGTQATEPDWRPLFDAAGLDKARFTDAAPGRPSAGSFDLRRAWLGSAAAAPDVRVRVEAGAMDGRAVSFALRYPWSAAVGSAWTEDQLIGMPALPMLMVIVWTSLVVGALFVRRNYRLGRLDVRAAGALAGATFCFTIAAWLLRAHLTPTAGTMTRLAQAVGMSLFNAVTAFIVYAGIDPVARRYWPASLVSWTRLVNGRLRDPLVGQDVLVGTLGGLVNSAGIAAYAVVAHALGAQPPPTAGNPAVIDITLGRLLGRYAEVATFALWISAGSLVGLLLARAVFRRDWLACLSLAVLGGAIWSPTLGPSHPVLAAVIMSTSFIAWFWTFYRFGMLAGAAATVALFVSTGAPTCSPSLWYGPNFLLGAALIVALAAYGFHTALAGRPLFREDAFGEEDAVAGP